MAGKNIDPNDDAKTTPKPIANGPPIYKNRSFGAQTATVDKPPITPAVYLHFESPNYFNIQHFGLRIEANRIAYHAARIKIGPPTNESGARIAPCEREKISIRNCKINLLLNSLFGAISYFQVWPWQSKVQRYSMAPNMNGRNRMPYHNSTMCGPCQLLCTESIFIWDWSSYHSWAHHKGNRCNHRHPSSARKKIHQSRCTENGSCTGCSDGNWATEISIRTVDTFAHILWPNPAIYLEHAKINRNWLRKTREYESRQIWHRSKTINIGPLWWNSELTSNYSWWLMHRDSCQDRRSIERPNQVRNHQSVHPCRQQMLEETIDA